MRKNNTPVRNALFTKTTVLVKTTYLLLLLVAFKGTAMAQTVEDIDTIRSIIDKTNYTDSITITDTSRKVTAPHYITGYLIGDTLLKTVDRSAGSSRVRMIYFNPKENYPGLYTMYTKEIDTVSNMVLWELYTAESKVLKSSIPADILEKEKLHGIMQGSNYWAQIAFARVDRKAQKYKFTARLVGKVRSAPGCGRIAWAAVNKFEVISTTCSGYDKKYVLIIQPCPEFLKPGFLQTGKIYQMEVATNSGVTFGYVTENDYKKEDLPSFWCRAIQKLD